LNWFYQNILNPEKGEALAQVKRGHIAILPIKGLSFTNPHEKSQHDKMVNLVDQMLEAKKKLEQANTDKDKTFYEGKCSSLDRQIDNLVYELYGLTEEEIKIVEGE